MKDQLDKNIERGGRFQSVPLFSISVWDGDIRRDHHLGERQVEISGQKIKRLRLDSGRSIGSQSEFYKTTGSGPRNLRLFIEGTS